MSRNAAHRSRQRTALSGCLPGARLVQKASCRRMMPPGARRNHQPIAWSEPRPDAYQLLSSFRRMTRPVGLRSRPTQGASTCQVTLPVSPDTGAVVNAVTVSTPPLVLAVMSVAWPLSAAVVVSASFSRRKFNPPTKLRQGNAINGVDCLHTGGDAMVRPAATSPCSTSSQ